MVFRLRNIEATKEEKKWINKIRKQLASIIALAVRILK